MDFKHAERLLRALAHNLVQEDRLTIAEVRAVTPAELEVRQGMGFVAVGLFEEPADPSKGEGPGLATPSAEAAVEEASVPPPDAFAVDDLVRYEHPSWGSVVGRVLRIEVTGLEKSEEQLIDARNTWLQELREIDEQLGFGGEGRASFRAERLEALRALRRDRDEARAGVRQAVGDRDVARLVIARVFDVLKGLEFDHADSPPDPGQPDAVIRALRWDREVWRAQALDARDALEEARAELERISTLIAAWRAPR